MNLEVDVWFSRQEIMDIIFAEAESLGLLDDEGEIQDQEKFTMLMVSLAIGSTIDYVAAWLHERGHEDIAHDLDLITNGNDVEDEVDE